MGRGNIVAVRGLILMGWALIGLGLALGLVWLWYFSDDAKLIALGALSLSVLWGVHEDIEASLILIAPAHACLIGCWGADILQARTWDAALFPGLAIPFIALGGGRLLWRMKRHAEADPYKVSDALFAHVGHELRTPLNALLCSAQLLDRDDNLAAAPRKHVETLIAAGRSMAELLNNLLDISRLRYGDMMDTQTMPVQMQDFVAEMSQLWQASAKDKGLGWQSCLDPRVPEWLDIDPIRVRQILSNLIDNAIRCTDQGGVSLNVSWQPAQANGPSERVVFEVTDSGCGISPEDRADLFAPFCKGQRGGAMGLGLAICRGLSEALGGQLDVLSRSQHGSVFTLSLPCAVAEKTENGTKPVDPRSFERIENSPFDQLRVLVAEDHPAHRHMLTTLLKSVGAVPVLASNGAEALQCLEAESFDLVFMDWRMPVMDGMETVRKIRCLEKDKAQIPVIFLTAGISKADRQRLFDAGIAAILEKPVDTGRLYGAMQDALAASEETKPLEYAAQSVETSP